MRRKTSSSPTLSPTASEYVRAGTKSGTHNRSVRASHIFIFWAIGMNYFMEIAKLRAARMLWAKLIKAFNPEDARSSVAAHTLPDVRLVSRRAGCLQQCRPHHDRGDGRDSRPNSIVAYQCARRSPGVADRFSARIARNTQIVLAARSRRYPHRGSVGRLLLCGAADLRTCARRPGATSKKSKPSEGWPRRSRPSIPKLRIEEAAAKTQARIDAGAQSVIGVNKYATTDERPIEVLRIDNSAVRSRQIEKLQRLKAERDPGALQEALDALTRAADRGQRQSPRTCR